MLRYVFKKKIYITLAFIVDAIGSIIFAPIKFFRSPLAEKFRKILVMRLDHIGDVVSSTAVLEPLKKKFPDSRVDFLAPSSMGDILKENPFIDNLLEFNPGWFDEKKPSFIEQTRNIRNLAALIKNHNYDLAIDLRGDCRHIIAMFLAGVKNRISYGITGLGFLLTCQVPYEGIMHETERNTALLLPLGVEQHSLSVRLYLPKTSYDKASALKEKLHIPAKYAVVHPIPRRSQKRWTNERFSRVIQYLYNTKGIVPVMAGDISDKSEIKEIMDKSNTPAIDIAGETSLDVLGAIMQEATLFIGVDSGPSHIAAAVGIPGIVLFSGINDPAQWVPRSDKIKLMFPGANRNLSDVKVEEVLGAIDEMLSKG